MRRIVLVSILATAAVAARVASVSAAPTPEPGPFVEPAPPPEPEPPPPVTIIDRADIDRAGATSVGEILQVTGRSIDLRSYASDWLVAPPGANVGGEMRFINAASSPSGERITATDLALLRLHGRWTASERIELAATVDVLAKQLDTTREPLAQGGSVSGKVAASRATAVTTGVAGGPALGTGWWGEAAAGVVHRSRIEDFISFQVGGGGLATVVRGGDMPMRWQTDATGSAELIFHTPRGEFALWLGTALALPVAHAGALDPSTRLDLTVGSVYSAVRDWDLYAEVTYRDRGTTTMPSTILPIIDGGFDQTQFVVGITRRFTEGRGASRWALAR